MADPIIIDGGLQILNVAATEIRTDVRTPSNASDSSLVTEKAVANSDSFPTSYGMYMDQRTIGTNGGTFTRNAWRTRTINTTLREIGNDISRSGNRIQLQPGYYFINGWAAAYRVNNHKTRIRDVTNDTTLLYGMSGRANNSGIVDRGCVLGSVMVSSTLNIEFQHRCSTTRNNDGLGRDVNFDEPEVYLQLSIIRIAGEIT